MTVPGVSKILEWDLLVTVIDRSMTVLRGSTPGGDVHLYESVIDQSMTVFRGSTPCGDVHLYKLSLTGQ